MIPSNSWHFESVFGGPWGRLHEPSCGVGMSIPGHPVHLGPVQLGRLVLSALVQCRQLPIALGVRLDRQPAAMQPAAMCMAVAQTLSRGRSGQQVKVAPASSELLQRWGAEAAGCALYPLAQPEPSGADHEELVVLTRSSDGESPPVVWQLLLVKIFDRRAVDPIRWSMWNAALMGSLRWAPGVTPAPESPPWPQSSWLGADLTLELPAERQMQLAELEPLLTRSGGELALLTERLKMLACGSEPPGQLLALEERRFLSQFLADASPGTELSAYWAARLAEVHTAHDLRGLALFGLRGVLAASASRPTSAAP